MRQHRYDVGQRVTVMLHDWTPQRNLCSKTVEAVILAKSIRPFGYNVELNESTSFRGNLPLPVVNNVNNIVNNVNNNNNVISPNVLAGVLSV